MVLSQGDKTKATIESLRHEVKEMNINFEKLEADVSIVKKVNNLLMKEPVDIQQQCWVKGPVLSSRMFRNSWNTNIYTSTEPWKKFCQLFEAIGVSLDKNDIDDCQRLRDKERTIVKFLQRKDRKQVLWCKKDLKSINMSIKKDLQSINMSTVSLKGPRWFCL